MQINHHNILLIEKYNMNNKTSFAIAAIAVVAALLVTTSAVSASNAYATHYKRTTQTLAQDNHCGNGVLPYKVDCQNSASQVQGKGNAASVITSQGSKFGGQDGFTGAPDTGMGGNYGGNDKGGNYGGNDKGGNYGGNDKGGNYGGNDKGSNDQGGNYGGNDKGSNDKGSNDQGNNAHGGAGGSANGGNDQGGNDQGGK
jgi:hypothetical protein